MLKWKIVDEEYLNYLRNNFESRIPYSNYGRDKYKPFFGELFTIGNMSYLTQISSPKNRHYSMKNSMDFIKIYDLKSGTRLLGVVNLNYMFPVQTSSLIDLDYATINRHRTFKDDDEKSRYINLLKIELRQMNSIDIENKAKKVYQHKLTKPNSPVSLRCFDFKSLESACMMWST